MRDDERTTNEQLKIELLSQWKLEAESRNIRISINQSFILLSSHHYDFLRTKGLKDQYNIGTHYTYRYDRHIVGAG